MQLKRSFSNKTVCILANSRQADFTGSKVMNKLKQVSSDQVSFTGYGGPWMKKEGFNPVIEFDIDQLMDKTFTTYRKTKTFNETIFFRWNPFNLINKHFTRSTDHTYDLVSQPKSYPLVYEFWITKENLLNSSLSHPEHWQWIYDIPFNGWN